MAGVFYRSDAMRFVLGFILVSVAGVERVADVAPLVVVRPVVGVCVDRGPVAPRVLCVGNAARPVAML